MEYYILIMVLLLALIRMKFRLKNALGNPVAAKKIYLINNAALLVQICLSVWLYWRGGDWEVVGLLLAFYFGILERLFEYKSNNNS